jgi:hypothetical protein
MEPDRLERMFADALHAIDSSVELKVLGRAESHGSFRASLDGQQVGVAWLSVGWPRQVLALLAQPTRPDLVAAPKLSLGARKLLTDSEISWFDGTGAARIHTPNLRVLVETSHNLAKPPRRKLGWTAATLAVSEALLLGHAGTVSNICQATGLAQSTVATSLKFLQEEQLLSSDFERGRNARRSVVDADDLLDAYAATAQRLRSPEAIRVGILWRDPQRGVGELARSWLKQGIRWSATGALAADVIAPHLTEVAPLEIYVKAKGLADLRQIALAAGVSERSGGRLLLRPFPTTAADALSHLEGKTWVACWPRVYADLRGTGVRGEDAAEHLREHVRKGA